MREHRAVGELDQAMDDALGVQDRLALVGPQAEQPLRLDQFQSLVGQRGRVDRDLGPHRPVRMLERVLGRHASQRRQRELAKRPAGGRQDNAAHRRGRVTLQALEDRVVFAVDRQQPDAVGARLRHDELAGHHQDLLRGEGEILARGQRRQRGSQPDGADHGHEHQVGLRQLRQIDQAAKSTVELRAGRKRRQIGAGFCQRAILENANVTDAELARNFGEAPVIGAGRDAHEFQSIAVGGHHAQGKVRTSPNQLALRLGENARRQADRQRGNTAGGPTP